MESSGDDDEVTIIFWLDSPEVRHATFMGVWLKRLRATRLSFLCQKRESGWGSKAPNVKEASARVRARTEPGFASSVCAYFCVVGLTAGDVGLTLVGCAACRRGQPIW